MDTNLRTARKSFDNIHAKLEDAQQVLNDTEELGHDAFVDALVARQKVSDLWDMWWRVVYNADEEL